VKKIGLFFGSFNPVHNGHIALAKAFLQQANLEELWVVLTPQNPHKNAEELAPNYHRLQMLKEAFSTESKNIKISEVEFLLPAPYYTANTLDYLEKQYPKVAFSILMGSDSLESLPSWNRYQRILEFPIFVYPRAVNNSINSFHNWESVTLMNFPTVEVSSTDIRQQIFEGATSCKLLPESVENYIKTNGLYQKKA
jgi:nicotinate-nucleotide adenylyltransferase